MLTVTEVPTPQAAAGDVVVEVRAAGVNPIDWKLYSGAFHEVDESHKDAAGTAASMPSLGLECAGVVTEVGQDVTGVQVGDEVIVYAVTAAYADTVIATAAERNHALLRELGATPVVYGPGLADRVRAAAPQGISAAVDFAGTDEALDVSLELVADRTRIASITGPPRRAEAGIKLLGYGPGEDAGAEVRDAARAGLIDSVESGALRVIVDTTFPLVEAGKAHEVGLAGHAPGKLVLIP